MSYNEENKVKVLYFNEREVVELRQKWPNLAGSRVLENVIWGTWRPQQRKKKNNEYKKET